MICKLGYIYQLKSPSGKYYIGQTIQKPNDRFRPYKNGIGTNIYFTNALKKYGFQKFDIEIFEVPVFMLNYLEKTLIRNLDSTNSLYGYNSREGGSNGSISEEQKKAISIANKNKIIDNTTRERMRISALGRKASDTTKKKLSLLNSGENNPMFGKKGVEHPKYGKKSSTSTLEKLRLASSGDKNAMFGKTGSLNPNSKFVYVYGNLYPSCIEASKCLRFLYPDRTNNFINTWVRSTTHPEIFLAQDMSFDPEN